MPYSTSATLAASTPFRDRVRVAMANAAIAIVGETWTARTSYHEKRHTLGTAILNNPEQYVDRFAWAVVADPAITVATTDTDLQNRVNAILDDLAGVKPSD